MYQKRIKIVKGDKVKLSILVFSSDIADLKGVITFRLDY
jgi:translation initiation factor IF-1